MYDKSLLHTHTLAQSGQEQIKVEQKCEFDKGPSLIVGSADRTDPPAERKPGTAFIKP